MAQAVEDSGGILNQVFIYKSQNADKAAKLACKYLRIHGEQTSHHQETRQDNKEDKHTGLNALNTNWTT